MSESKSVSKNKQPINIGVVGGGQLAQMLCKAAKKKNISIVVQTGSETDPAITYANKFILSPPNNVKGTEKLTSVCDKITFENEWLDIKSLIELERKGINFLPSINSLSPLVDKISQRKLLTRLSIPGPEWISLSNFDKRDVKLPYGWKFPIMAKASHGGYDGKGTKKINNIDSLISLLDDVDIDSWFLESWVEYDQELAIVASRDSGGIIRYLPLVETFQRNQICDWVFAPANVNQQIKLMVYNIVSSILVDLDYVGVIAIEFFYGSQGLLVNEIAPRTHNSTHFSIEACNSSQFDQQISIVSDIPVTDPKLISAGAIMVNLIGLEDSFKVPLNERLNQIRSLDGIYLHWYGKLSERPGRKLGHVTVLLNETDKSRRKREAEAALERIRTIWPMHLS